jgi:hypothetical protein
MKAPIILAITSIFLVACGGGGSSSGGGGGGGGAGGGGATSGLDNASILGSTFVPYTEANEANNNTEATSEITSYVLNAEGIKINGTFEASGVSSDFYHFNTGSSYGTVDVRVFINGVKQYDSNYQVGITLNNMVDDGYSTLRGSGYFINASVSPTGATNQDYVLGITQDPASNVAGMSYTIELHHKI